LGQSAAAAHLAGLLGFVLVAYAIVLLALRIRRPVELGGHVDIDRPPERVFAEITNLRRPRPGPYPAGRIQVADDGPIRVGTRFRESLDDGQERTFNVRAFDPPRLFETEMDPTIYESQTWWLVEPRAANGSRLSRRHLMRVPLYWSARPKYRRQFRRLLDQDLLAWKRRVEEEPPKPSSSGP
jgi:hypothetical protein